MFELECSCYYIPRNSENHKTSWSESRIACQKLNADLVSINDKAENDFIYSQTRSNYDFNNVWIGLSDIGHINWYSTWVDQSSGIDTNFNQKIYFLIELIRP